MYFSKCKTDIMVNFSALTFSSHCVYAFFIKHEYHLFFIMDKWISFRCSDEINVQLSMVIGSILPLVLSLVLKDFQSLKQSMFSPFLLFLKK